MTTTADALLRLAIPESRQDYTVRDTMLYALGVGAGSDPVSPAHLMFVYEEGLKALPSFPVVMAHPGFWQRDLDTGLDYRRMVHGEQRTTIFRPLPTAGVVHGRSSVVGVADKGEGRGALAEYQRELRDEAGNLLAVSSQTLFCRGDGGVGSGGTMPAPLRDTPERAPDLVTEQQTLPQQALLYRLSGDYNPLHADPAAARQGGFDRPILQGLATYGAACFMLITALGCAPEAVRRLDCRFKSPAYPGDRFELRIWREPGGASFELREPQRGVVLLGNGFMELSE